MLYVPRFEENVRGKDSDWKAAAAASIPEFDYYSRIGLVQSVVDEIVISR